MDLTYTTFEEMCHVFNELAKTEPSLTLDVPVIAAVCEMHHNKAEEIIQSLCEIANTRPTTVRTMRLSIRQKLESERQGKEQKRKQEKEDEEFARRVQNSSTVSDPMHRATSAPVISPSNNVIFRDRTSYPPPSSPQSAPPPSPPIKIAVGRDKPSQYYIPVSPNANGGHPPPPLIPVAPEPKPAKILVKPGPTPVSQPSPPAPRPKENKKGVIDGLAYDVKDSEQIMKLEFDYQRNEWRESKGSCVLIEPPFQEGTMRMAFHMVDLDQPDEPRHLVAKMSKDANESTDTYYTDVEMQMTAKAFAYEYNMSDPPKRVDFVDAWLIRCKERKNDPLLAVEPYMNGKYVKHTNNYGFVSQEDRNTPQAFSHFSYVASKGELLICDIQGVDDKYTDPQFHSKDGRGYGKGNLGMEGISKFFQTHRCNAICQYLKLPATRVKQEQTGTVVNPNRVRGGSAPMLHAQPQYSQIVMVETPAVRQVALPINAHRCQVARNWSSEEVRRFALVFDKCAESRGNAGAVDEAGVMDVMNQLGYRINRSEAHAIVKGIDAKGLVTRNQFLKWLTKGVIRGDAH